MAQHNFTKKIEAVLAKEFGASANTMFQGSPLIGYLNAKTASASKGSKSRGSFGNIYAVYVLVEDYVNKGFADSGKYEDYDGARFSDLFKRQRELPFGAKLQNHALNHRMNQEFKRLLPTVEHIPILRDTETNRYWFNENLLIVNDGSEDQNIAHAVMLIVEAYIDAKQDAFKGFLEDCEKMKKIAGAKPEQVSGFVLDLLRPNVDARIFEIVSFSILKVHYSDQSIYWGWSLEDVAEDCLQLFKTGRTNANDGGIDFVMKPLGKFFQVTEVVDVKKYFLDIDKIQRFPLTFVVKVEDSSKSVYDTIRTQAKSLYTVEKIVNRYMECVEEVINIPMLREYMERVAKAGKATEVIDEVVRQSKVEFNIVE